MTVLAVDGHRLGGQRTGVGRYLFELLREWARADLPFEHVVVYVPPGTDADVAESAGRLTVQPLPGRAGTTWFHWSLARAASREAELLFCPSYAAPLAYRGLFVVTVHDALSAVMPPQPGMRQRLRHEATKLSARRARRVLTVSETSRRDIAREYGVPEERIAVVPNGCSPELFTAPSPAQAAGVRRRYGLANVPFILFAGKFAHRRHLPELIQAFAEARRRLDTGHLLVLCGEAALPDAAAEAAGAAGVGDSVRVPGYVPDADLHVLYHEAEVFCYPSSYEGFGLPVLEAMATGTPVLAVNGSAVAEVAGDAALLVEQPTREALADALVRLLSEPELRRRYAGLGTERAGRFTWKRSAEETIAVLAAVASDRR